MWSDNLLVEVVEILVGLVLVWIVLIRPLTRFIAKAQEKLP